MASDELRLKWEVTRAHLKVALTRLDTSKGDAEDTLRAYAEWLDNNELELAYNELEAYAFEFGGSREFWMAMLAAATTMEMGEDVKRCQKKLDSLPT